jgi:hypothetical protein
MAYERAVIYVYREMHVDVQMTDWLYGSLHVTTAVATAHGEVPGFVNNCRERQTWS